ncbi:MAG: U32 family peptidase [Clostridia bacterium]|nr:U32 family peptidase [Clostridia bacterium]
MNKKRPELLAPVNLNTLEAAVINGADAVYLGGNMFSARKSAKNFDINELEHAVDYCHLHNTKVYLTVNTLISDDEIKGFYDFVFDAATLGVDAFIVQDIGAASLIKTTIPDVPLHASTQMTVHNLGGALLAKEFGFKRVVLARELSGQDIELISKESGIETEVFVHGALCVSYSGQCLMSSLIGGRSGNRGACAQPCRLPYKLYKDDTLVKSGYLLNTKDLSLAGKVPELIASGVSSFKIEGRMKDENYVAASVSVFRKCIDKNIPASDEDIKMLENAFSRGGFTEGFYTSSSLASKMRTNRGNNDVFDKKELLPSFSSDNGRKLPVDICISAHTDKELYGKISYNDFTYECYGDKVSAAINKPTEKDVIDRQMSKLGGTSFDVQTINIDVDENIFLPLKSVNELRRNLTDSLSKKIVNSYKRYIKKADFPASSVQKTTNASFTAHIRNTEQYSAVSDYDFAHIFVPVELFEKIEHKPDNIYVFPDIIRDTHMEYYTRLMDKLITAGVTTVSSGNYAIFSLAKEKGLDIWGSSSLNIFNTFSIDFWQQYGLKGGFLSNELTLEELSHLGGADFKKIMNIYGHITAMTTAYCPVSSSVGKCDCNNGKYILTDRKNESFAILKNGCSSACNILNSKPVYMAERMNELKHSNCSYFNFLFTTETANECKHILELYKSGLPFDKPFTRGHFYRGITQI